jgi:hypothetical protein
MLRSAVISLLAFLSIPYNASGRTCAGGPVAMQILGSGGPAINSERPSASAPFVGNSMRLICVDNLPRLTNVASK